MYAVKNAGLKGLGVFATTAIPRGTRILAEHPLFTVKSERDVWAASRKLEDEDKDWMMQLSVASKKKPDLFDRVNASLNLLRKGKMPDSQAVEEHNTLLATFRNNNFDIGENTQAIFRNISRLNHSCVPNSQGNFNTSLGRFTIHAVRPIEDEEEITISYLTEHGAPRDVRLHKLSQGYGFTCDCPICDGSKAVGKESNERRVRVIKMLREHAERSSMEEKPNYDRELEVLQSLISMFEEEGLAGRELATMYMAAAEWKVKTAPKEAKSLAKTGLQMELDCLGNDNPLYHANVARMRRITG